MSRYKRRVTIVEAVQYRHGMNHPGVTVIDGYPCLQTMQSQYVRIREGEWIIAESVPGRFYPCDPSVFAKTYELAEPL